MVEPKFKVPESSEQAGRVRRQIIGLAEDGSGKPRKQKRTVKQLHARSGRARVRLAPTAAWPPLPATGRRSGAREQQTAGRGAFVPLVFQPGEAFQFDWSEDWAIIGGERIKLQVAQFKLSHSRAFLVAPICCKPTRCCLTPITTRSGCLAACRRRGIYDNMRTAVDRVWTGKKRQVNARFLAMASHYLFETEFCNPASGWEKGQVEKKVQDATPSALADRCRTFPRWTP